MSGCIHRLVWVIPSLTEPAPYFPVLSPLRTPRLSLARPGRVLNSHSPHTIVWGSPYYSMGMAETPACTRVRAQTPPVRSAARATAPLLTSHPFPQVRARLLDARPARHRRGPPEPLARGAPVRLLVHRQRRRQGSQADWVSAAPPPLTPPSANAVVTPFPSSPRRWMGYYPRAISGTQGAGRRSSS